MSARVTMCTFTLGGRLFGVEVAAVREVLREQPVTPVPLAPGAVTGLINLRGRITAAVDLRRCLHMEAAGPGQTAMLVVLRESHGDVGLVVDEIREVLEISPVRFEAAPPTLKGPGHELIRGVFKLEDGLLQVLDVTRTMEAAGA